MFTYLEKKVKDQHKQKKENMHSKQKINTCGKLQHEKSVIQSPSFPTHANLFTLFQHIASTINLKQIKLNDNERKAKRKIRTDSECHV